MPVFDTPGPIAAKLELVVGDVRITASDRTDTVVVVRPSDSSYEPDIRAAEQTRVELTASGLLVKAPKQRSLSMFSKPGSIDVAIELPAGSSLNADAAVAVVRSAGQLGECRVKTATGTVELDQTGPLEVTTGAGAVSAARVAGAAEITTGSGRVRLSEIDGPAVIKNSNGETWVGDASGDLRISVSNGSVSVDHAGADVTAVTANGSVRIGAIVRGLATLKTGMGEIEIGIQPGTAARIDAHTRMGNVRNEMDATPSPGPADEVAEVSARTSFGDITIRRA
jgi:DUF4097 and DUF4098 domain-containing protein YvlB